MSVQLKNGYYWAVFKGSENWEVAYHSAQRIRPIWLRVGKIGEGRLYEPSQIGERVERKREDGFYWLKISKGYSYRPAEWIADQQRWSILGMSNEHLDPDDYEVGPRMDPPEDE